MKAVLLSIVCVAAAACGSRGDISDAPRPGAGSHDGPVGTGGCATETLVSGVESLTGLTTTSFTGCYQASSFSIADP